MRVRGAGGNLRARGARLPGCYASTARSDLEATRTSACVWCSIGAEMANVLSAAKLKETIQQPRHQVLMEGLMRSMGAVMASVLSAAKLKETMSTATASSFAPNACQ